MVVLHALGHGIDGSSHLQAGSMRGGLRIVLLSAFTLDLLGGLGAVIEVVKRLCRRHDQHILHTSTHVTSYNKHISDRNWPYLIKLAGFHRICDLLSLKCLDV